MARDLPEINPVNIDRRLREICALGNRYVGTVGEELTRELISRSFRAAGLDTRTEVVRTRVYEPQAAWCSVDDGELTLAATGLQYSAVAECEASAVYLGAVDSPSELLAAIRRTHDVSGHVVVVQTPVPFAICGDLTERGAAGIVVISGNAAGEIGDFISRGYPPDDQDEIVILPIPGVAIEARDGHRLISHLVAGTKIRILHDARHTRATTANVVAEKTEARSSREHVVIGAHYDSQLRGVGACDNASGVAALLEIAEGWSKLELDRKVSFVAFAAEEHGCRGSLAYCRAHADDSSLLAMLNLDALASAFPARRALHVDPALETVALLAAKQVGWTPEVVLDASLMPGSDVNPFIDHGVPAGWFWEYPPPHPFYHSAGDVPQLVDCSRVARAAQAAACAAFLLASDETLRVGSAAPSRRWLETSAGLERDG